MTPSSPQPSIPRFSLPPAFVLVITCLIILARPHSLLAASSLQFEVRLSQAGSLTLAEVVEDGRAMLGLTAVAPEEANQKALLLADKLNSLAALGKGPDSFVLISRAGSPAIACGSEIVLAFEPTQGHSPSSEQALARWLENIKAAFARPYLSVPSTLVGARTGQEVMVPVRGPGLPFLEVSLAPSYIAQATVQKSSGRVVILGKSVGQARLDLRAKNELISVTISVVALPSIPGEPESNGDSLFPPQAKQPPLLTWFSNHPENVSGPTQLFHAQFPGKASGRLFYHHKSIAQGPLKFAIWLANRDPQIIQKVFLVRGAGGPTPEAPTSGRHAIVSFYSNWTNERGQFLTLRPGEFRCLDFIPWEPYSTVGGLYQFTCLSEGSLDVYLEALDSDYQPYSPSPASLASLPTKEWLFPGDRKVPFSYVVGEDPTHFLLGLPGEKALTSQRILRGSYGVQQSLDISISNPSPASKRVELRCLAGGGGIAHFVGLLNGRLVSVELPASGASASLGTFTIAPGDTLAFPLLTTSVGGCWYPVVLTLQTQPS